MRTAECLDKALALDPEHYDLLLRLSTGYVMKKDWKKVTEGTERFLAMDPPRPLEAWAVARLGKILQGQGDRAGGGEMMAEAKEIDPDLWMTFMPPPEII